DILRSRSPISFARAHRHPRLALTDIPVSRSPREPVEEAQVRPDPGRDREAGLLRPREAHLRAEDVVVAEEDAPEELLVDEPHRLRRRERLPILLRDEEARAAVVLARTRALERHHLAERLRAVADEH